MTNDIAKNSVYYSFIDEYEVHLHVTDSELSKQSVDAQTRSSSEQSNILLGVQS